MRREVECMQWNAQGCIIMHGRMGVEMGLDWDRLGVEWE